MNYRTIILLPLVVLASAGHHAFATDIGTIEIDLHGGMLVEHPNHSPVQVKVEAAAVRPDKRQLGPPSVWRINSAQADGQGGSRMWGSLDLLPDTLDHTRDHVLQPQSAAELELHVSPSPEGIRYTVTVQNVPVPERVKSLALTLYFKEGGNLILMTKKSGSDQGWASHSWNAIQKNSSEGTPGPFNGWKIGETPSLAGTFSVPAEAHVHRKSETVLQITVPAEKGATATATLWLDPSAYSVGLDWDPWPPQLYKALANPKDVTRLTGLRQNIPEEIGSLVNLERLSVGGVTLRELPETIGNLSNLTYISVSSGNHGGAGPPLYPESLGMCTELKHIRVYGNYQFFALPESLGQLKKLEMIEICHTGMRTFPESIGECQEIWFIKCPDNPFTHFPESLTQLKKLSFLDIAGAGGQFRTISELPKDFGDLESLEHLHADGRYASLPESFNRLSAIQTLAIDGNFSSFPSLSSAEHLRHIEVRRTAELEQLEFSMATLPSLAYLSIQKSPGIQQMPDDLAMAVNLRYLDLGTAELSVLPTEIATLPRLAVLRVHPSLAEQVKTLLPEWKQVPDSVNRYNKGTNFWVAPRVPDLKGFKSSLFRNTYSRIKGAFSGHPIFPERIDLSGKGLSGSPMLRIGPSRRDDKVKGITHLNLSDNPITGVNVGSLALLTDLQELDLRGTQLDESVIQTLRNRLPKIRILSGPLSAATSHAPATVRLESLMLRELAIEMADPDSVVELSLAFNEMESLPAVVFSLPNLRSLDLEMNFVHELSGEIAQLKHLQQLDLNANKLVKLPESIGALSALESLDLSLNELEELPASLGQLSKLCTLALVGNHLRALPKDLSGLMSLETLDLRGNPIPENERARIRAALPNSEVLF